MATAASTWLSWDEKWEDKKARLQQERLKYIDATIEDAEVMALIQDYEETARRLRKGGDAK